ncbi:3',5'-cyclic-nucleotide phosphodiesterase (PDEase) (3':5'-CNP) [Coelomomyces lativittatus]|nr:3',5'-cyclic-nucleotide phosphodiesterase (PDEase) (3':5'-CNP) [Coelomomyces lativittatus]
MFNLLRQESETINELKGQLGTNTLPTGCLALGIEGIKAVINTFDEAKTVDKRNERLPPARKTSAKNSKENTELKETTEESSRVGSESPKSIKSNTKPTSVTPASNPPKVITEETKSRPVSAQSTNEEGKGKKSPSKNNGILSMLKK